MNRNYLFLAVLLLGIAFVLISTNPARTKPALSPTPSPQSAFTTYNPPKLPDKKVYRIVLVGDSMTHALGPHGGRLGPWLMGKFTNKGFIIDNYAYSTNILSLPAMLTKPTNTWDLTFDPILSRDFDIIIIESFGYNPLPNIPRDQAFKMRRQILDQTMKSLIREKPGSLVVLVSTIAPSKALYAYKTQTLTTDERQNEVNERIAYLEDHRDYAKSHNIPFIDVYQKSLVSPGDGNIKWVSPDDYIHPSVDGLEFISQTITNALYDQNLLPH